MGYTLGIGELDIEYDNEENEPRIVLSARGEAHDNAPAFGEPTDHENQRWPSYTTWANFCRFTELYELFYGKNVEQEWVREDALLAYHPGCVPLTEKHRKEINEALDAYRIKYPKAVPTYGNTLDKILKPDLDNPEENWQMPRLIWLHYWVNWALDNCKRPVFKNS